MAILLTVAVLAQLGCNSADSPSIVDQQFDEDDPRSPETLPNGSVRPTLPPVVGTVLERGVTVEAPEGNVQLDNAILMRSHRGDVFVDPESGEYAWPAMVCTNPNCSGQKPHVFIHVFRTTGVDPEGNLIVPDSVPIKARIPRCPACQETKYERFEMPEAALRKKELDEELVAVRLARRETGEYSSGMRHPQEIFEEIAGLPKLFLFSNE